ncbi:ABC transporter substrate-binding protein, partial [Halobacteriales archaeon QH_8_68_33]
MSDSGPSASRRAFLAGVAASGLGAGCLAGAAGGEAVSLLAAGSIQRAL